MSFIIRKAKKEDLSVLVVLMDQLGYIVDAETLEKNLLHYHQSVYVAEIDAKVVGCLAFHILPQFHSEELYMRVVTLVIDVTERGKGVGKQLLALAEQIARESGCAAMELTSALHRAKTGAHAFYRAQGYESEETVYFRKKLTSQEPRKKSSQQQLLPQSP